MFWARRLFQAFSRYTFPFSSFIFLLISGSCIGYVGGHCVGFQHLYSEALWAFRMNVDLLGLARTWGGPISGGAYEHSWEGHIAGLHLCGGGHERGVRSMSMNIPLQWLGVVS